jgi:protein-disulfide isomerase
MRRPLMALWLFIGGLFLVSSGLARGQEAAASREPLASVSGQPVYEKDLLPLIQGQLRQLQQQEYQVKRKALDELINQKLVEAEAKKKGIPAEKLLAQEVDAKVPEPTDGEVESYYLAQQPRLNQPLEDVEPRLRQQLKQAKVQLARQNYLAEVRKQAGVVVHLAPVKVAVTADPSRLKGDANAPVTIVEFSDFQCPFCKQATPTLAEVLRKYEGKVRLSYRDFPLRQIHPQAQKAAEAARCAAEQGKFWEYHDLLFADQAKLDVQSLTEHARSLKLSGQPFEQCLASGRYTAAVGKDLEEGRQAGVSGTPAFFINGTVLSGALSLDSFTRVIDEELARAR